MINGRRVEPTLDDPAHLLPQLLEEIAHVQEREHAKNSKDGGSHRVNQLH